MDRLVIKKLQTQVDEVVAAPTDTDAGLVTSLCQRLIAIYDDPFGDSREREMAAEAAGRLVNVSDLALTCVRRNAEAFERHLQVEDSWPYAPNSSTVLAAAGR